MTNRGFWSSPNYELEMIWFVWKSPRKAWNRSQFCYRDWLFGRFSDL